MGDGIRRDALAIFFLTVGIFLTVALVSFHQMDPSLSAWSSKGAAVRNWGGTVGAIVSDLLLQLFGLGAVGAPIRLASRPHVGADRRGGRLEGGAGGVEQSLLGLVPGLVRSGALLGAIGEQDLEFGEAEIAVDR